MVRKLGIKGFIKPTEKRRKSIATKQRKLDLGVVESVDDCFFSSVDILPPHLDTNVLADL